MPCDSEHQYISPRQQRRTKMRTRPEKKNSPMGKVKRKYITKPMNYAKIAELKAHRGQQISDAEDYQFKEQEIECARLEKIAIRQYLDDLLSLEIYCYTNIPESERDLFMLTHGPAVPMGTYGYLSVRQWPY